ncbi:hypothetical protein Q8A64_06585 [Oxalobacteraceae bacterium R-40]|uniref:Uncharacterized protein n=1 Tax=Keguizhuia sedimenti TaxID=3064264 RepID=A0ABU1BP46_9BURK|nr:hypothetical protein [Oxalobacteraceae bacterium R-40]
MNAEETLRMFTPFDFIKTNTLFRKERARDPIIAARLLQRSLLIEAAQRSLADLMFTFTECAASLDFFRELQAEQIFFKRNDRSLQKTIL